jgi:Flp pilus assembly protein TadG
VRLAAGWQRLRSLSRFSTRSPRSRDEQGVSAVEFAFIAPALIFLIFFSIQGALFFYGRSVAIQSAREGVSQLRLAQDEATYDDIRAGVKSNTEQFATAVGREALIDPLATPSYDPDLGRVRMKVEGRVISLIPWLDLKVTEEAAGPVERFEGAP